MIYAQRSQVTPGTTPVTTPALLLDYARATPRPRQSYSRATTPGPRQHYSWTTLGPLLDHDRATPELPPDYHRLRTYAQELTDHALVTGSSSTSKGPQTTTPSSTAGQLQHQQGLSDTALASMGPKYFLVEHFYMFTCLLTNS